MNLDENEIVFLQHGGSVLYGLNTKDSDEDIRGVAILSDPSLYFGYLTRFEQKESWDDHEDKVAYEFRKAIKLIADGNPNMVDLAFSDPRFHLKTSPEWELIRENRAKFLSKKMKHSYTGYAHAQYKKLKNSYEKGDPGTWNEFDKKVGYKCKYAMHMVRLVRMAEEILRDGEIHVLRPDADELLDIRQGGMTYADAVLYMGLMDSRLDRLVSDLPRSADHKFWDELCVDILSKRFRNSWLK